MAHLPTIKNQQIANFNLHIVGFINFRSILLYGCEKREGCYYAFWETIQGI